ncbi:hypothetical protein [Amycolatopsis sp. FDAARGOS 1241]|uniref:hypothetical protein n=1 Tax=Amycolatopsis sp. FDAARGOS 1241 TaxID=2778070 RepID=UPI00194FE84F|nr:hypothetical protein [Amycolatopsis sp. FDAARGOS 1241]QRP42971.1 hypothetical protein I6J71_26360 [Amycolatopsis sp. FDAARGOS 1241]
MAYFIREEHPLGETEDRSGLFLVNRRVGAAFAVVPPTEHALLHGMAFPGSDGGFLHIGAAANLLDFTVIPAIQEFTIVLDWQLTVQ